jgi:hypothetical protein
MRVIEGKNEAASLVRAGLARVVRIRPTLRDLPLARRITGPALTVLRLLGLRGREAVARCDPRCRWGATIHPARVG